MADEAARFTAEQVVMDSNLEGPHPYGEHNIKRV